MAFVCLLVLGLGGLCLLFFPCFESPCFSISEDKEQNALQTNGLGGSNDSYNAGVRVKSIHVGGVKLLKCNAILAPQYTKIVLHWGWYR